jgi:hypothetical protein
MSAIKKSYSQLPFLLESRSSDSLIFFAILIINVHNSWYNIFIFYRLLFASTGLNGHIRPDQPVDQHQSFFHPVIVKIQFL